MGRAPWPHDSHLFHLPSLSFFLVPSPSFFLVEQFRGLWQADLPLGC